MGIGEAALASLIGEGETEAKPEPKAGPRYIYYRVYTKFGALESKNPIYSNDRFISRTASKSVAPPHTAASLKKHLCQIEGFDLSANCTLYQSPSDQKPAEDSVRLSLRRTPGTGVSELDPVALVVDASDAEKRSSVSCGDDKDLIESPASRGSVYYRVYNEGGDIPSKTSFDVTDSSLGRIDGLSVPPPHTSISLKSRLTQAEGISPDLACQLFEDESGECTLSDGDAITLLADCYPGVSREEPIAIVYGAQKGSTSASKAPSFTKKLRANFDSSWADYDSRWHTMADGEIFHTDGVLTKKPYTSDDNLISCYVAINSAGKIAFLESRGASRC